MKAVPLLFLAIASSLTAQTLQTNFIRAAPKFREVDGKLYNIEKSILWRQMNIAPSLALSNGMRAMLVKPHYAAIAVGHVGGLSQTGGLPVGPAPAPHIDYWESVHEVFIRNCPPLAEGQLTNIFALKVGVERIDGYSLEKWDYGTPHIVPVVTTNQAPTTLTPKPKN